MSREEFDAWGERAADWDEAIQEITPSVDAVMRSYRFLNPKDTSLPVLYNGPRPRTPDSR